MLREIFRAASEHSDGLVVIAGDVYDCLELLPREKDLFVEHLCRADRDGLTTIIVSGNHDMIDEDDGGYTHLRGLKLAAEARRLKNTHIFETEPASFVPTKFPNLSVIAVPSHYRQTKEVNKIIKQHLKLLHQADDLHDQVLAVVHETILGAKNDFGKRMGVDFGDPEHCVTLDADLPVTYWALGDIHRPQRIKNVHNAWYCGCPIQHDFGDSGDRGVLLVDLDNPTHPELIELKAIKKLVTVEVTSSTKPDEISRNDAHVRLVGRREYIKPLQAQCSNVVSTKPVRSEDVEVIEDVKVADVLRGLPEILADMGLSPKDQQWCLTEAEHYR